ncbi:hypothetical protein JXA34_01790, partial [Patescibacteria group bacterium]|nr:hypothetical protein [Patescibacteria group bacterium]
MFEKMKILAQESVKKPDIKSALAGLLVFSIIFSSLSLLTFSQFKQALKVKDAYNESNVRESTLDEDDENTDASDPDSRKKSDSKTDGNVLAAYTNEEYDLNIYLDTFFRNPVQFLEDTIFAKSARIEGTLTVLGESTFEGLATANEVNLTSLTFRDTAIMNDLGAINAVTKTTLEDSLELTGDVTGFLNDNTVGAMGGIDLGTLDDTEGSLLGIDGGVITNVTSWSGDIIAPEYGGTGLDSYDEGDILYADGSDSLDVLNIGSSGYVLFSDGDMPEWDEPISRLGLDGTSSGTGSGAYLIGVYDEFTYSSATNVQDVLDDLDTAIASGGISLWTDGGTISYLTATGDHVAMGGSGTTSDFYLNTSTGSLSLDNYTFFYNGANNRLGIGTSSPQGTLDVAGNAYIATGYDLHIGSIGIGDSGTATTSGAYLIGVYDELTNSDNTRLQDILDDLDQQISILGGGSSKWADLGSMTTLTSQTDNLTVGGSTPQAGLYFIASTGSLSLDNYSFYYNGSGRLGIGD